MAEDKTIRELINENRRLRESVENQTKATKETSDKLKDVGGVIKDDLKGVSDSITAPMKQFVSAIPGLTSIGKIVGILAKPKKMSAAEVEKFREEKRASKQQTVLLAEIAGGILDLKDSFLKGLQKGAGFGLGAVAALIAAPVITLVNFFKSLGTELKFLNQLTGGRLTKLFQPFVRFFNAIEDVVSKAGTRKILKGDTFKVFGRFTNFVNRIISGPVKLFNRIMKVLGKFPAIIASATSSFAPIAKFAAGFGRILGKIFLPITIIMSAFDAITGFIDGFSNENGNIVEKVIAGIQEAIISVVDGLVGGLIRMITGAVAWILDLLGFENFANSLTTTVNGAIEGIYDAFRGIIDVVVGIFSFDLDMITSGLGAIWSGVTGVVLAPFNMLYGLVQDLFSFVGIDLPDFNITEWVTEAVSGAINSVKRFFGFGGSEEEDLRAENQAAEDELRRAQRQRNTAERAVASGNYSINGRQATEEEGQALIERMQAEVDAAHERVDQSVAAMEEFNNAPRFSDYLPSWEDITSSLGSAKDSIVESVTGLLDSVKQGVMDLIPSFDDIKSALPDFSDLNPLASLASAINDWQPDGWIGEKIKDIFSSFLPTDGARAVGGPVRGSGSYLVGENGPELFMPGVSGQVVSNNRLIDGIARQTANMVAMADAERSALEAEIRKSSGGSPVVINNSPTTVNSGGGGGSSFIPVAITNRGIAWQGNDF